VLLLARICLLLVTFAYRVVPVTYFMVSIPGIIAGVTLPLSYDICLPLLFLLLMLNSTLELLLARLCLLLVTFAYRRCSCYLFYGEFNTWYYCWRDSVSC
jgi:hypothetical protein